MSFCYLKLRSLHSRLTSTTLTIESHHRESFGILFINHVSCGIFDHLTPLQEDLNDLLHAFDIADDKVYLRFALKKLGFGASLR